MKIDPSIDEIEKNLSDKSWCTVRPYIRIFHPYTNFWDDPEEQQYVNFFNYETWKGTQLFSNMQEALEAAKDDDEGNDKLTWS